MLIVKDSVVVGVASGPVNIPDMETRGEQSMNAYGEIGDMVVNGAVIPKAITESETIARLTASVQRHLESEAKAHGYDSILTACSYASADNPFQREGAAFVSWRGQVWAACYAILAEAKAGARALPTPDVLVERLPAFAP